MKKPVFEVTRVRARLEGNEVVVEADGTTRTGGWSDPELAQRPVTGDTLEFDFVATPPSGGSTQAITPISAHARTGPLEPPFPTQVRIFAETNDLSEPIGTGAYAPPKY